MPDLLQELWAWVVIDSLGHENILTSVADRTSGVPMIGYSREYLDQFTNEAVAAAAELGLMLKVATFCRLDCEPRIPKELQ